VSVRQSDIRGGMRYVLGSGFCRRVVILFVQAVSRVVSLEAAVCFWVVVVGVLLTCIYASISALFLFHRCERCGKLGVGLFDLGVVCSDPLNPVVCMLCFGWGGRISGWGVVWGGWFSLGGVFWGGGFGVGCCGGSCFWGDGCGFGCAGCGWVGVGGVGLGFVGVLGGGCVGRWWGIGFVFSGHCWVILFWVLYVVGVVGFVFVVGSGGCLEGLMVGLWALVGRLLFGMSTGVLVCPWSWCVGCLVWADVGGEFLYFFVPVRGIIWLACSHHAVLKSSKGSLYLLLARLQCALVVCGVVWCGLVVGVFGVCLCGVVVVWSLVWQRLIGVCGTSCHSSIFTARSSNIYYPRITSASLRFGATPEIHGRIHLICWFFLWLSGIGCEAQPMT